MNIYRLFFDGYWREENKAGIPHICGIYVVYRCVYNVTQDVVSLKEIIYIGQAKDVHERINNHERTGDFIKELKTDEQICYSCAEVEEDKLDFIENALTFVQKPRLNTRNKDDYNYGAIQVRIGGACGLMKYSDFNIK